MNLVLLFAGCAPPCPTFEETEIVVEDPAGAGLVEETVRGTVAWFAEATLREGVCVEEIGIVDAIPVVTSEGEEIDAAGHWDGRGRIEVTPETGTFGVTLHELCHALDYAEGIVYENPHLFTAEQAADRVVTREEVRANEAFAEACEAATHDLSFKTQMADTCGLVEVSERDRFLAEEVYPGLQSEPLPLGPEAAWGFWEVPLGRYEYVASTFSEGEIVVLTRVRTGGGRPDHALVYLDPADGARRVEPLPEGLDGGAELRFLEADEGLWIEVALTGTGLAWAGKRWLPFDVGLPDDEALVNAAISEGVLYGMTSSAEAGLVAWHPASGALIRLEGSPPGPRAGPTGAAWPVEGGMELALGSLLRWVDGEWTRLPLLQSAYTRGAEDGTRRGFVYPAGSYGGLLQELDVETGEASFRPICRPVSWRGARVFPDGTLLDRIEHEDGTRLRFGPLTW